MLQFMFSFKFMNGGDLEQPQLEKISSFLPAYDLTQTSCSQSVVRSGSHMTSILEPSFQVWRRRWHPTPVLLPGKCHGRSLWAAVQGVVKSRTRLSDFTFTFHFSLSCIGEGNGNPLVFLPGESQGWGSLVGCRLWGCTESDTTEATAAAAAASRFGEGNGNPLQYSCLASPMDGEAWQAAVHGVVKRWTRLSDFTFTFHFHALEKEMATHSSVIAWRILGTGEPGGLPSMGQHRVRHD